MLFVLCRGFLARFDVSFGVVVSRGTSMIMLNNTRTYTCMKRVLVSHAGSQWVLSFGGFDGKYSKRTRLA
jgi:hypothetical protein